MTGQAPYHHVALLTSVLLVSLTVTPASTEAGLLDKVKASTSRLASVPLITAISDYTNTIREKGTALIKDGLSGTVDAATYNRRADEFFDKDVHLGVKSFLQDAADNLKLKVANPLEGVKETLGDTRLGHFASRVTEKLQGTMADGPATGVAKTDAPYGTIDPRLALDINQEETEWYRDETGIMDEASLSVAYLKGEIDSLDDALEDSQREVAYQDDEGWADQTDVAHRADEAQESWSDTEDGADEWEDRSTPEYCRNAYIDIDALSECDDGYQGQSQSVETNVVSRFDEAQEGTYQEALDRLVGDDTESYADAYSGSNGGYEGALEQLEAEAVERERQARLEAEAAEREARLAAEAAEREREAQRAAAAAERERQARLAAKRAERERKEREYYAELEQLQLEEELSRQRMQQDYNSSFLGQFNNMMNGIMGMAPTFPRGGVASQPSSHCQDIAPQLGNEVARELNAMNLEGGGMCQSARNYIRVLSHAKNRLNQHGCYNGEYEQAIQQAQQSARASCANTR